MKICAIICEFNPFHNGHKYLLEQAKRQSGCDAAVCVMSGSFTQRGDLCIADKYVRAKHAVLGGADCVLELPAAFATSPAEIFARGAIKIISAIPEVTTLAFGCESGDKAQFLSAANTLLNESEQFKSDLSKKLAEGESYIKSYQAAFKNAGGNAELLAKPNNVLALEYVKAILRVGANIDILPIKRVGADYGDGGLKQNFSSASAIRGNLTSPIVGKNVPQYVFNDIKDISKEIERFKEFQRLVLSRSDAENLKRVYGVTEGMENKFISLSEKPYDAIVEECTSKRYSATRIKRAVCANFLGIYADDTQKYLSEPLYFKPLAVKKGLMDEIFGALAKSDYPTIFKGRDQLKLGQTAKKCINCDDFCYAQWRQIMQASPQDKLVIVE